MEITKHSIPGQPNEADMGQWQDNIQRRNAKEEPPWNSRHEENMLIQLYWKFKHQKMKNFR